MPAARDTAGFALIFNELLHAKHLQMLVCQKRCKSHPPKLNRMKIYLIVEIVQQWTVLFPLKGSSVTDFVNVLLY